MKPTQSEVANLFSYDPASGRLTFLVNMPPRGIAGEEAGWINKRGYRRVSIGGWEYPAHHVIWLLMTGSWPTIDVDHRNRVRSDNTWSNLRQATRSNNLMNQGVKHNNRSGYRGVNSRGNSHVVVFREHGKTIRLGPFSTTLEAALEYDREIVKRRGEFAVTNKQLGLIS
ncbi:HNH homing endonuclease [Pseudomonas phage inbricus]|uniref:HNH homing endonuclease n=1 Tax=Pseudomonas phage inbricus TaxID=2048976 RepID=A0A2H4P7G8_9CAUD|nr:HNH homing endonuclease [Pseudomonas phage inbricus]ATW58107.1 HNH homing endonuclease [Pseudomonas phage inbricus]